MSAEEERIAEIRGELTRLRGLGLKLELREDVGLVPSEYPIIARVTLPNGEKAFGDVGGATRVTAAEEALKTAKLLLLPEMSDEPDDEEP